MTAIRHAGRARACDLVAVAGTAGPYGPLGSVPPPDAETPVPTVRAVVRGDGAY